MSSSSGDKSDVISEPTIAALATAPAAAGIAVVRVSGPQTRAIIEPFLKGSQDPFEQPRMLCYARVVNPQTGAVLDRGMIVFFKAEHSFTGEDAAEFHLHGSMVVVTELLNLLYSAGATVPAPGEFTQRAYLNDKIDLLQAEAVGDLIAANSLAAVRLANQQLSGRFSNILSDLGTPIREALAETEAGLDFPEEEITPESSKKIIENLSGLKSRLEQMLGAFSYGQQIKHGYKVLICGEPNVGKSSLLNALLATKRAIVSDSAGTTRDLIEETATIGDLSFVFCDSAGIRAGAEDKVERLGIELALNKTAWADLLLLVVSAEQTQAHWKAIIDLIWAKLNPDYQQQLVMVINKCDLTDSSAQPVFADPRVRTVLSASAESAVGLAEIQRTLVSLVQAGKQTTTSSAQTNLILTNQRHKAAVTEALQIIEQILLNPDLLPELLAVDLRAVLRSLEELVGVTSNEDILGLIFSKFCVGK